MTHSHRGDNDKKNYYNFIYTITYLNYLFNSTKEFLVGEFYIGEEYIDVDLNPKYIIVPKYRFYLEDIFREDINSADFDAQDYIEIHGRITYKNLGRFNITSLSNNVDHYFSYDTDLVNILLMYQNRLNKVPDGNNYFV
jgi:hypothetical protein